MREQGTGEQQGGPLPRAVPGSWRAQLVGHAPKLDLVTEVGSRRST